MGGGLILTVGGRDDDGVHATWSVFGKLFFGFFEIDTEAAVVFFGT